MEECTQEQGAWDLNAAVSRIILDSIDGVLDDVHGFIPVYVDQVESLTTLENVRSERFNDKGGESEGRKAEKFIEGATSALMHRAARKRGWSSTRDDSGSTKYQHPHDEAS